MNAKIALALIIGLILGGIVGMVFGNGKSAPASSNVVVSMLAGLNDETVMATWKRVGSAPAGSLEIARLPQDICPRDPDGPCGFDNIIMRSGTSYYVTVQGGAGSPVYGPFEASADSDLLLKAVSKYTTTLKF